MFFYITVQRDGHAELVSASGSEPYLVLLRGQILKFVVKREQSQACLGMPSVSKLNNVKQVQDEICVLTAHRSQLIAYNSLLKICVISVPLKILYKTVFSYKSSWKVESAQLENFYFPTGKLFFLSWKIEISQ